MKDIKNFFKILTVFGEIYDSYIAEKAKEILKIYEEMEKNPNFEKITEGL